MILSATGGIAGTINGIKGAVEVSSGEYKQRREQQAQEIYGHLVDRLQQTLGWTIVDKAQVANNPDYAKLVCLHLSELVGCKLITAPNLIEATQDCGAFVQLSGVLKRVAVKLSKTCNDLRLLSSGPRAGFGEAFVDYYARIKEAEIARSRKAAGNTCDAAAVTEWEHREYFDML